MPYWKAWKASRSRLSLKRSRKQSVCLLYLWKFHININWKQVNERIYTPPPPSASTILRYLLSTEIDFDTRTDAEDSGKYIKYVWVHRRKLHAGIKHWKNSTKSSNLVKKHDWGEKLTWKRECEWECMSVTVSQCSLMVAYLSWDMTAKESYPSGYDSFAVNSRALALKTILEMQNIFHTHSNNWWIDHVAQKSKDLASLSCHFLSSSSPIIELTPLEVMTGVSMPISPAVVS